MRKLTHFDKKGKIRMVDITDKRISVREAQAYGEIKLNRRTIELIKKNKIIKGDVLTTAHIAGISACKKTHELIPLTHPLSITYCNLDFEFMKNGICIKSIVKAEDKTGVEMEALISVSMACLAIYDMVKAVEKKAKVTNIKLIRKIKK